MYVYDIYEYDPDYVNDSLTAIRNKLTELEDRSRTNNTVCENPYKFTYQNWKDFE